MADPISLVGVMVNVDKDADLSAARAILLAMRERGGDAVLAAGVGHGAGGAGQPGGWHGAAAVGQPGGMHGAQDAGAADPAQAAGAEWAGWPDDLAAAAAAAPDDPAMARCDAWICIGGDGTIIRASKAAAMAGVPLLGMNRGTLGYLAEAEPQDAGWLARRLVEGDYRVEERMLLHVAEISAAQPHMALRSHESLALNEVVVSRGTAPHVISLELYVNSTLIDVYSGDGILVSTPTGSTAYAFSAGGPIVDPELELFSIVPICPHMILPKPVLVEPGKTITIVPHRAGRGFSAAVAVDGAAMPSLRGGSAITVRRAARPVRMVRFAEDSFYTTLKHKLYHRGEVASREKSRAAGQDTQHHRAERD